jgi:hypothetical protein
MTRIGGVFADSASFFSSASARPTMTPTDVRAHLVTNGFTPLPCIGKRPVLKEWQARDATSVGDLETWAKLYPDARNTGILCTHTPALDIDVLSGSAVNAAIELVRERFEGRGKILLRYGRAPKVAILFRAGTPFKKISAPLTAPDGATGEKIEFLCEDQQVIVDGAHPDTRAPYQWSGGLDPSCVRHDELPPIAADEARMLVDDIAALTVAHGYRIVDEHKRKSKGNGHDGDRVDWGQLYENIRTGCDYYDTLRDLSCKMVASGMNPGAVVNILRDLMEKSEAPHDQRWRDRCNDIPRLVDGAVELLRQTEKKDPPPPDGEGSAQPTAAVGGAAVLNLARDYLKKYVSYPSPYALTAHVLWIAHTHMLEAFDSTARLGFLSAFPESGKTRALEATETLVCRPISTVNASANYLYRKADDEAGPPTVLFDEIDTVFGPKAKDHEDIRGFINAGHRKGATYGRCRAVGNKIITEDSPCYAAVVMAGLGWLPDTLLSRAVVIRMQRRLASEKLESFRTRTSVPEGKAIGAQLAAWAASVSDDAAAARPKMPADIADRQADAWEPLLAVADLAGEEWSALAREAAIALVKANRNLPLSLEMRLLQDLRLVFWKNLTAAAQARPKGLPTETVLNELYCLEDAPWQTINKGEQYGSSQLANRLFDYGVEPIQLRPYLNTDTQKRGYPLGALALVWRRYLKPLSLGGKGVNAVTPVTRAALDAYFDWVEVDDEGNPVTAVTGLTGFSPRGEGQETEAKTAAPSAPPLVEKLSTARVKELAKWWCARIKQLQKELSPALAKDQIRKDLCEVLAEELIPAAVDDAIKQVARAATPKKPAAKRRSRR